MAFKKFSSVAWRGKRTAVKKVISGFDDVSYDMWEWNVWKRKWVRLGNTACGFGSLEDVKPIAEARDKEIADMLYINQQEPKPL